MSIALPPSNTPFGSVVRGLRDASDGASEAELVKIRRQFDKRFGRRLDYRLWRSFYYVSGLPHHAVKPISPDLSDVAAFLTEAQPFDVWGAMILLRRLVTESEPKHTASPDRLATLGQHSLETLLATPALEKARISCEIVRLSTEEVLRGLAPPNGELSWTEVNARIERCLNTVRAIDPLWTPGQPINLRPVEEEKRLLPFGLIVAIGLLYRPIVSVARTARSFSQIRRTLDTEGEALLATIAGLSRTAWHLSRAYRIRTKKHQITPQRDDMVLGSLPAPDEEYLALKAAAQDALDAGDELSAAALAHLMFRIGGNTENAMRQAYRWAKWIHQCGLEIDERFRVKTSIQLDESDVKRILEKDRVFSRTILHRTIGIQTSVFGAAILWKFHHVDSWEPEPLPTARVIGPSAKVFISLDNLRELLLAGFRKLDIIDARSQVRASKAGERRFLKVIPPVSVEVDSNRLKIGGGYNGDTNANDSSINHERKTAWRPFWARFEAECSNDADWNDVLGDPEISAILLADSGSGDWRALNPFVILKCLTHAVEQNILTNQKPIRGLFKITLRHHFVSLAEKCLRHLPVDDRSSTLGFVHAVKEAQQILPFGLDEEQHAKWLAAIKERFASQVGKEGWHEEHVLFIHEVLLGRSLAMMRSHSLENAHFLAAKFYDLVSERELRGLWTDEFAPLRRGPGAVNRQRFGEFSQEYRKFSAGPVLYVSVVSLNQDRISVLVTDGGKWLHEEVVIENHAILVADLRDSCGEWLTAEGHDVPFNPKFTNFVTLLHGWSKQLKLVPKTVLIAADTVFAGIPWQDLVRRFWPSEEFPVVALIPSFTWASFAFRRKTWPERPFLWLQNTSAEFTGREERHFNELRFAIRNTWQDGYSRKWSGVAVLAGHGNVGSDGFPVVRVAFNTRDGRRKQKLEREDWLELADYFTIVAHVCFSGAMEPAFLGNFGGMAGMVLGFNTRLVCAPVSEIPAATATTLQRHLGDPHAPAQFSARYRAAIREDPRVGLYLLFGFPAEFVEIIPR